MKRALLGFIAPALLMGGCAVESGDLEGDLATRTEELREYQDPSNPDAVWKYLSRLHPSNINADIDHKKAPILCAGGDGGLAISVDSSNNYRVLQFQYATGNNWITYGTKQFSSRPACAMREDGPNGTDGFVLGGKATDNKIYASAGVSAPAVQEGQGNPNPVEPWTLVSNTTYSPGGNPAMSSNPSSALIVFMGTDNRTIYAHARDIPYLSSSWSARIAGPTLPTGWTVTGTPTVAFAGLTFHIVVRAKNGNSTRLYMTHFYAAGAAGSEYFSNVYASPALSWTALPSLGAIDSDPSLTFHVDHGFTIYFLRGTQIMQTSAASTPLNFGQSPIMAVYPARGVAFTEAPAAVGYWGFESQGGRHTVIGRTYVPPPPPGQPAAASRMYYGQTNSDGRIIP